MRRILVLLVAASLSAGCTKVGSSSPSSEERHAYTHPHELRFASAEDIVGLNSLTATQATVSYMSQMTAAWLVRSDAKGEATIPELVTEVPTQKNGGVSADGKTITWHIRHGVVWSDGVKFDADDVVFSTNEVNNPANNVVSRDGWDQIASIGEPDKYTVVYHLKKPYSGYLATYFTTIGANPSILPKHLLQGYKELNDVPFNSKPIGIGPFKYEEWRRGESVTMVPNPTYWRGAPKLQRVVFKIIPDRNTVVEQLQSRELDLWTPVAPHFYPQVKAIPGISVLTTPSFFFDHLDFNLTHPVLQDRTVRQALRYAIDRPLLNDKIRNGLFIIEESVVPPASADHQDLPLVPFDLAKANSILDAGGWKRGADGIRAKNGLRLSIDYASSVGSPDTDLQIELIRGWWKQIGVDFQVKRYQSAVMFAPAQQGGIIYGGKFDVVNFAWGGDPTQDLSNLYACYRFPPNGQNDPRYCNQGATAAMDRLKSIYDREKRGPELKLIQQDIYDDVPIVVLDARHEIYAFNSDLKGFQPNPVAPFDDMMRVDI